MKGYHDAILNTWGKRMPANVDLHFFFGNAASWMLALDKEVCLDVPDDYINLPFKTKAICKWSVEKKYDYTFLCDTDTFLIPKLLMQSGFEKYDYSGQFGSAHPVGEKFDYSDPHGNYPDCYPWTSGGVGYFLSERAARIVTTCTPDVWAEDLWVGQCLGGFIDAGMVTAANLDIEGVSAWHFPRRKFKQVYDPKLKWMESMCLKLE